MFSMDALIVSLLPIIGNFLMANKFTIMAILYALDKLAKYTDTTVDDSIVTLLKNTFLKAIGRGDIVNLKLEYLKEQGLINEIEPLALKKASDEFDEKMKSEPLALKKSIDEVKAENQTLEITENSSEKPANTNIQQV